MMPKELRSKIVVFILLLACLFRFIGIYPGHNKYHPDEPIVYGTVVDMIRNENLDMGRYDYPSTVPYINYILYKTIFIPLGWMKYYAKNFDRVIDGTITLSPSKLERNRIRQIEIFGEREINSLYWSRYITAFFGVGTILLLYLLGKEMFGWKVGSLAALFLVFDFKHVQNSHLGLPDIYNSFFLLLALLAIYKLYQKPTRLNYLWAGVLAGLSFSIKYQVYALLPLFITHILISFNGFKFSLKKFFSPKALIVIFAVPFVFLLTNPYFFIHLETALGWMSSVSLKYGMGTKKINLFPLSYLYNIDIGPSLTIISFLGIIYSLFKKPRETLIVSSVLAFFTYIFLYYSTGGFYIRNLIVITPLLFLFASNILVSIFGIIRKYVGKYVFALIFAGTLVLLVWVPARNSIINCYYWTKDWTYNMTSKWLFDNWDSSWVLAAHPFDPPTGSPPLVKTEFEISGAFAMREHIENGAEYSLINTDWAGNTFYGWMGFGFDHLDRFVGKPMNQMRNSFFGLAAEELFRYQIFSATKPWQATDSGLVLSKFPVWSDVEMIEINKLGDISLTTSDNRFGDDKVSFEPIEIEAGHLYEVSGFLKSEKDRNEKQRDGFLRVEFYENKPDGNVLGENASVSSRIWGKSDWQEKTIIVRAPQNSRYMLVGLQASEVNDKFWAKGIVVRESKDIVEDITSKAPYIKKQIDLNLLYPNSHGNL